MGIPTAERSGDEADAGFDQADGQEGALAKRVIGKGLGEFGRLFANVEGFAGFGAHDEIEGLFIEFIESLDEGSFFFEGSEAGIEFLEEAVALLDFIEGGGIGEGDAADGEGLAGLWGGHGFQG